MRSIRSRLCLAGCLLWAAIQAQAAAVIQSVRVWPAADYTRITFEASEDLHYRLITLHHPERLVLQLDHVQAGRPLDAINHALRAGDPYIRELRVGQYTPDAVRVVLALKSRVKPAVAMLPPVGHYGHRLVLDIYPAEERDPLAALIAEEEAQLMAAEARQSRQQGVAPPTRQQPAPADRATMPVRQVRRFVVAIDAGHGGEDPGARGLHGTFEKQVTLAIARKLKTRLNEVAGVRAVLVRDGDYFIPLHQRVIKARRMHADLFVSIHADSDTSHTARGSSVYALSESGATSVAARLLAKHENEADRVGGISLPTKDPYLARTLLDLSQTATITDSLKLGKLVLHELGDFKPLHNQRVEQAGFAVLKSPDIPSILVETDFINNPDEERKLADSSYQDRLARAIVTGVRQYIAQVAGGHATAVAGNNVINQHHGKQAMD